MSKPFKQVMEFEELDDMNAWLSSRKAEKYETDILILSGSNYAIGYFVIYWEQQ